MHKVVVWTIHVGEDGRCFSCSNDGCVAVFKIVNKKIVRLQRFRASSQMVWGMDIDIKRDLIAVGDSVGEISIFKISTEEKLHCTTAFELGIYDVCLIGDYCFASSFGKMSARYCLSSKNCTAAIYSGDASPLWVMDGLVIAGSRESRVDCWDIHHKKKLWALPTGSPVSDVKVFQNKIVAATQSSVRVWDRETPHNLLYDINFTDFDSRMYSLLVMEDSVLCTFGDQVVSIKLNPGRPRAASLKYRKEEL